MADALNTYLAAMASTQKKPVPPHEQLSKSASLPDEYLMNYPVMSQRQAITAARWQQHNPQLFYQQLRLRTPHIARRPILPRKSLNSWMAFRSFYQNLFPHLQQKEASTYLTTLWKQDPFKAKWTVIAAAYSKIRDAVGKPRAPLDKYMSVVCPQMGIIGVQAYLSILNWTYENTTDGSLVFAQITAPDLHALDPHLLGSNLTEQDLIRFCGSVGYIPRSIARRLGGPLGSRSPRQGLLASTPAHPFVQVGDLEARPEPVDVPAPQPIPEAPMPRSTPMPLGDSWTGSMADLYHPSEGSVDFEQLLGEPHASAWNTIDIDDPVSLDRLLGSGGLGDGFLAPCVPKMD